MQDKELLQDILMLEKGACDLYMHGTVEASTNNINSAFKNALNESLTMQDNIYKQMESKGWYQTEQAQQDKIDILKNKFQNMQ
ncbi:MAG: spore coat protein [Eubacterium sp.]|nr:spore coat protein [Eubacterium sp.]